MNGLILVAAILAALVVGFLLGHWDKTVTEKQRIELVAGRLYVIIQEGDERRKAGGATGARRRVVRRGNVDAVALGGRSVTPWTASRSTSP